jgi:hypothetical protein
MKEFRHRAARRRAASYWDAIFDGAARNQQIRRARQIIDEAQSLGLGVAV